MSSGNNRDACTGLCDQHIQVLLLGAAQDGGFPQFGCICQNCMKVYNGEINSDSAVSLAVLDKATKQWWLIDPTPQLTTQWNQYASILCQYVLAGTLYISFDSRLFMWCFMLVHDSFVGIFITHAHAGHYPGLLYIGKEALNANQLPVYCSERMHQFLRSNEPWGVMYRNRNINPVVLYDDVTVELTKNLKITPSLVPHRADFTDTFAYSIIGKDREMYFCPDIDHWDVFNHESTLKQYLLQTAFITKKDILLLDATFYDNHELLNRDMSSIPHPRVVETARLVRENRAQVNANHQEVVLIHMNHSNPLWADPQLVQSLNDECGISVGRSGMVWYL